MTKTFMIVNILNFYLFPFQSNPCFEALAMAPPRLHLSDVHFRNFNHFRNFKQNHFRNFEAINRQPAFYKNFVNFSVIKTTFLFVSILRFAVVLSFWKKQVVWHLLFNLYLLVSLLCVLVLKNICACFHILICWSFYNLFVFCCYMNNVLWINKDIFKLKFTFPVIYFIFFREPRPRVTLYCPTKRWMRGVKRSTVASDFPPKRCIIAAGHSAVTMD